MPGDHDYAPTGRYSQVSVTEDATGRWYATVIVDALEGPMRDGEIAGIDLGVRKLATLSDGTIMANPRALKKAAKKMRRLQKALSRSQKGSGRRQRKKRALARAHRRVACVRRDAQHKATTAITKRYATVVVESLNVSGMTSRAHGRGCAAKAGLNRAILDAGFGTMLHMLAYKGRLYGCRIIEAARLYPSSKLCSACGAKNDPGRSETYRCASCGAVIDRDLNAARNLAKVAASLPETENARGAVRRPLAPRRRAAALKRESCQRSIFSEC